MKSVGEWAREFNLLYNNLSSNKAPGLDPYEVSVLLTRAQENVVRGLCTGAYGDTFESTEITSQYLAPLIKDATLTEDLFAQDPQPETQIHAIAGDKSHLYKLPDNVFVKTYEHCTLEDGNCTFTATVTPVTQDEFWRTYRNPFKGPGKTKVLRLVSSTSTDSSGLSLEKYSEIISKYNITGYYVRYIERPEPIILVDLGQRSLKIDGKSSPQTCLLDEALHQIILAEAVRMAKAVWNA